MIENFIFFVLCFMMGYILANVEKVNTDKVKKKIKSQIIHTTSLASAPSAIVYRPNANKIKKIKSREDGVTESFDETLGELPEIKKAKKLLEKGG